ncbi:hypothetical protein WCLP8_3270028 [uncultured Gammaproteobacteria bacterium]
MNFDSSFSHFTEALDPGSGGLAELRGRSGMSPDSVLDHFTAALDPGSNGLAELRGEAE